MTENFKWIQSSKLGIAKEQDNQVISGYSAFFGAHRFIEKYYGGNHFHGNVSQRSNRAP